MFPFILPSKHRFNPFSRGVCVLAEEPFPFLGHSNCTKQFTQQLKHSHYPEKWFLCFNWVFIPYGTEGGFQSKCLTRTLHSCIADLWFLRLGPIHSFPIQNGQEHLEEGWKTKALYHQLFKRWVWELKCGGNMHLGNCQLWSCFINVCEREPVNESPEKLELLRTFWRLSYSHSSWKWALWPIISTPTIKHQFNLPMFPSRFSHPSILQMVV